MGTIKNKFKLNEKDGSLVLIPGRLEFWNTTIRKIGVDSGQARCHSFSQDFIAVMLHNIMSLAIAYPNDKGPVLLLLDYLGQMVYGTDKTDEWRTYDERINDLMWMDIADHLERAVDLANDLMHKLNNARYNLRPGNQSWNASISNDFDPTAWNYVGNVNGRKKFISHNSLIWQPETSGRPEGIHLTDPKDVQRMLAFQNLQSVLQNDYEFGIDVYEDQVQKVCCYIVGSSSNKFKKPGGCRPEKCSDIYIDNAGSWASVL